MSAALKLLHPRGNSDDWFTPMDLFGEIGGAWTVDAAGHPEAPVSQAIGRWWDIEQDGLSQSWAGERVWVNPPYSDIAPWVQRAHEQMRAGCLEVAVLVPSNRTEQRWWQEYVEPYRDGGIGALSIDLETTFIARRRKFGWPGDPTGRSGSTPQFGLVLLRWTLVAPPTPPAPKPKPRRKGTKDPKASHPDRHVDIAREALVQAFQRALAVGDPSAIARARSELLASLAPLIVRLGSQMGTRDAESVSQATLAVAERLEHYRGSREPGRSALYSWVSTIVWQSLSGQPIRDASPVEITPGARWSFREQRRRTGVITTPTAVPLPADDQFFGAAADAEDYLLRAESERDRDGQLRSMQEALQQLPDPHRTVLALRRLQELRPAEAAREMGITMPRVRTLELEALGLLRAAMGGATC